MDDGGRCLLDVINDPHLLQSFLENSNSNNGSTNSAATTILTSNNNVKICNNVEASITSSSTAIIASTSTTNNIVGKNVAPKSETRARKSMVSSVNSTVPNRQSIPISLSTLQTNTLSSGSGIFFEQNKHQPATFQTTATSQALGIIPLSINSIGAIQTNPLFKASMDHSALNVTNVNNSIRASNTSLFSQILATGPRAMTVLPQQFLMPAGVQVQSNGFQQFVLAPTRPSNSGIQPGTNQLLQIIQTSQGPQIIPQGAQAISSIPPTIAATTTTVTSTGKNSKGSTKQILPKPNLTASKNTNAANSRNNNKNSIKLIQQSNPTLTTNVAPTQYLFNSAGPQSSQQILTGSQGTFFLNNINGQPFLIQGNSLQPNQPIQLAIRPPTQPQPLFLNNAMGTATTNESQGNLNLTISSSAINNKKSQQHNQQTTQTFLTLGQNPLNAQTANGLMLAGSNIRSTTSNLIIRPHLIAGQQQAATTAASASLPPTPNQPQFLQIQTPNGPVLVSLNSAQTPASLPPPPPQPQTIQIGNTVISLNNHPSLNMTTSQCTQLPTILTHQDSSGQFTATLQPPNISQASINAPSLFINAPPSSLTSAIATSRNNLTIQSQSTMLSSIISPNGPAIVGGQQQQSQQITNNSKPSTKSTQSKGLNLADLLKETGILPDLSPPNSPTKKSNSTSLLETNNLIQQTNLSTVVPSSITTTLDQNILNQQQQINQSPSTQQQTVLMVPGGNIGLNTTENFLLTQPNSQANNQQQSQLKISDIRIAPDGTLVLLSPNTNSLFQNQNQSLQHSQSNNKPQKDHGIGSSQPSPDSTTPSIDVHSSSPSSLTSTQPSSVSLTSSTLKTFSSPTVLNDKTESTQNLLDEKLSESSIANGNPTPLGSQVFSDGGNQTISSNNTFTSTSQLVNPLSPATQSIPKQQQPVIHMMPSLVLVDQNRMPILQLNETDVSEITLKVEKQLKILWDVKNPSMAQKNLICELMSLQKHLKDFNSKKFPSNLNQITQIHILISKQMEQVLELKPSVQQKPQIQSVQTLHSSQAPLQPLTLNSNSLTGKILLSPNPSTASLSKNENGSLIIGSPVKLSPNATQQLNSNGSKTIVRSIITEIPINTPKSPKIMFPFKTPPRPRAIKQQLGADQKAALRPDVKTPFKSKDDACKRLLRFHVFDDPSWSQKQFEKFDELYEGVSRLLLMKRFELYNKFSHLLLKQSMKKSPTSEHVMLNRLFVADEKNSLKSDKEFVQSGGILDLPPIPENWFFPNQENDIEAKNEVFMEETNVGFKRKSSMSHYTEEDDFFSLSNDTNRMNQTSSDYNRFNELSNYFDDEVLKLEPDQDHSDLLNHISLSSSNDHPPTTDVDELIKQLDSPPIEDEEDNGEDCNQNNSLTNFSSAVPLNQNSFIDSTSSSNDNSLNMVADDLEALYSNITGSNNEFNLQSSNRPSSSWSTKANSFHHSNNIIENNHHSSWSSRFGGVNQTEAAVAVQSILGQEQSHDNIDFSDFIDEVSNNNFNQEPQTNSNFTSSNNDETNLHQSQSFADIQMNCAIRSIMLPSPTGISKNPNVNNLLNHQPSSFNSMDQNNGSINQSYSTFQMNHQHHQSMLSNHHIRTSSMISSYPSTMVNDTILDEAVKSIL